MEHPKYFAFVLMPFDSAFNDIYKIGIKAVVSQFGDMIAERVDEQMYREGILERIYRQIELADIVIADMTGQNPNVFYEVGYAHAKSKLCILLTSDAADIPFDSSAAYRLQFLDHDIAPGTPQKPCVGAGRA
jgi:nucleoside 2-deoxyribosyltransferase